MKAAQSTRLNRLQALTSQFDKESILTGFAHVLQRLPVDPSNQSKSDEMLLGSLPYDNLPRCNNSFFGRQKELEKIAHELCPASERASVGLYGVPGSGKSQLALEYAHRKSEDKTYDAVLWVSADTEVKLSESFGAISKGLGILGGHAQSDHKLQRQALLQWFVKTSKSGRFAGRYDPFKPVFSDSLRATEQDTSEVVGDIRQCV